MKNETLLSVSLLLEKIKPDVLTILRISSGFENPNVNTFSETEIKEYYKLREDIEQLVEYLQESSNDLYLTYDTAGYTY